MASSHGHNLGSSNQLQFLGDLHCAAEQNGRGSLRMRFLHSQNQKGAFFSSN